MKLQFPSAADRLGCSVGLRDNDHWGAATFKVLVSVMVVVRSCRWRVPYRTRSKFHPFETKSTLTRGQRIKVVESTVDDLSSSIP